MNVSFIVIGRNEGERLRKCLHSVNNAIVQHQLDAEIIYVDSQSTDHSLHISKEFSRCRSYIITGQYNSAIARNIGVKEAMSDNLVFLDGDMELESSFLPLILNESGELKYEFVSGNFMNFYHTPSGRFIRKEYYKKIYCEEDTYQPTTGGLFAIKRQLWVMIGGMRPLFKKGQDLDLGYRLAAKGHFLLRKKETMAVHHTIDYQDPNRLWRSLRSGASVYSRAVLYRCHFNNKYVRKRMLSSDPTLIILALAILFFAITNSLISFSFYLFSVTAALMWKHKGQLQWDIIQRILIHLLRDLLNLVAFLFFYPSNKVVCRYEQV